MSKYFQVGTRVLWNPSMGVGRLFAGTATAMEVIAERPSGLTDTGMDEYEIDPPVFAAFVDALIDRLLTSGHPILSALMENFVATAAVLVERESGSWPPALVTAGGPPRSLEGMRDLQVGGTHIEPRAQETLALAIELSGAMAR